MLRPPAIDRPDFIGEPLAGKWGKVPLLPLLVGRKAGWAWLPLGIRPNATVSFHNFHSDFSIPIQIKCKLVKFVQAWSSSIKL
jgi:hypothetical protein